jgi:hypothetical protein
VHAQDAHVRRAYNMGDGLRLVIGSEMYGAIARARDWRAEAGSGRHRDSTPRAATGQIVSRNDQRMIRISPCRKHKAIDSRSRAFFFLSAIAEASLLKNGHCRVG